jgi:hypothetical protein
MTNDSPISGFQFAISGMSLSGSGSGGAADIAGLTVETGPNGVLGVGLGGEILPQGDGLLTTLTGTYNSNQACVIDIIISYDIEGFAHNTAGECLEHGLVLDIPAPTPKAPSMTMAVEEYVKMVNK